VTGDIFQRVQGACCRQRFHRKPRDLQATKNEIIQLRTQLINLGNSAYAGRYVFTGFKTDQKLLDENGNFLLEVSNNEQINYEIGLADSININVLGSDLFNNGADITDTDVGGPGKFIQDMNDLINALDTADYSAISGMAQRFSENLDNVLRIRADVGARVNRLELTANRLMNDNTNFTRLMSDNENCRIVTDTIMTLKNEENVYKSVTCGGARIIMPSLIDFPEVTDDLPRMVIIWD
jgi:flagellar hook-associated protein 3 FlgL